MVLVKNRKPSRVGLPTVAGSKRPTVQFDPGTHDYPEEDMNSLNTASKAVRSYLEGDDPVLSIVDGGPERADPKPPARKSAAELKDLIAESNDLDWLRMVLNEDDRTTVKAAADQRIADVEANANAGVAGDGGSGVATGDQNG